ncbi:MAG: hypothetical protein FWF52_01520 [Candidatus Azobacteroides sp.]|nr:hypothetical protein [Candidatus Azobacteroides sp.]
MNDGFFSGCGFIRIILPKNVDLLGRKAFFGVPFPAEGFDCFGEMATSICRAFPAKVARNGYRKGRLDGRTLRIGG